ncbi:usg protein [Celeribacter ethanolicus]|uniref:usg protein n=1 Tax=Celeribacter ethanolicus TaxID=1758178 RepID=UPI0008306DA5|nr:aspartate-semialdehyde dehydrogenase [Celeribacter ethanolicus]
MPQTQAREMSDTEMMLSGYGLTLAEFTYRMPDYRSVLNTFSWQLFDLAPDYPKLFKFIEFWQSNIEGPLHHVRFTHRKLIAPGEWRNCVGEFRVH